MIIPIIKVSDPVLYKKAKKVSKFDSKLRKLIRDMSDTLIASRNPEGVGLAAPQVGISLRLFVTRPEIRSKVRAYINPVIIKIDAKDTPKSKKKDTSILEGCLSMDRIWSPITRPFKVQIKYQTSDSTVHTEWFEGFEASIMHHEIDHLNGILFTNRAIEQKNPIFEEKNGKFEEVKI